MQRCGCVGGEEVLLPTLEREFRVRAGRHAGRQPAQRGGVGLGPGEQKRLPRKGNFFRVLEYSELK